MDGVDGVSVGLVGLGAMGMAVAERLLDRGVGLMVYNRTSDVAEDLAAARGARTASTPREVAATCDVILTCVADVDALHAVCTGSDGLLAGLRRGGLLIDLGTTGPALVDRLAPRVAGLGAALLECPVAGTPARARRGELTLLTGGDRSVHDRAEPLLTHLGQPLHVGPLGRATTMKVALNTVLFALNQATAEALLLAEADGVDARAFLAALRASPSGAAIHDFLAPQYVDASVSVGAGTLRTVQKDLDLALDIAAQAGVPLPQAHAVRAAVAPLVADGHGSREVGTLPDLLRDAHRQTDTSTERDMADDPQVAPVPAGEGRVVRIGPLTLTWKEEGTATAGRLAVAELTIAPGPFNPPPHLHREHDEGFYVLEGQVLIRYGDEEVVAGPGDWLMVPVDVPHTFSNPGDVPARLLCTFSPNQYVEYFDRLSAAGREHGGPPPQEVFADLMADYATEIVSDEAGA